MNSFIHDDIFYVVNSIYKIAENLFKNLYTKEDPDHFISKTNFIDKILPEYTKIVHKSFFPYKFSKIPYTYKAIDIDMNRKMKSIDMNRAYGRSLRDLPYLIFCDFRYAKITKNPENIIEHYLYNIECYDSILTPTHGLYTGSQVLEAKKRGIEMIVKEEIETVKTDNYFKDLINDLYEMDTENFYKKFSEDRTFIKDVINFHIGKMAKGEIRNNKKIVTGNLIVKDKETNNTITIKIGKDDFLFESELIETDNINIMNNIPLHIQIKDFTHLRILQKIEELGLSDDDIVAIKTDNIIYYSENAKEFKADEYWKDVINFSFDKFVDHYDEDEYKNFSLFNPEYICDNNNVVVDGYAGMGKTTKIINDVIPKLGNDYIVLSPTHCAIRTYRDKGLNCATVDKYALLNKIPKETNIIIDEMGMMNNRGWVMCIKASFKGKRLFLFGDLHQLPPAFEEYREIQDTFLNKMFKQVIRCKANYRNNIDVGVYEKLMKNRVSFDVIDKLIDKYLNCENPEIYIGITKKIVMDKNLEILGKKGKYNFKTRKFKNLEGEKVLCRVNDYAKHGLYNNFEAKILSYDEKEVVISFEGNEIKVSNNIFFKRFRFAYAINLHCFQGRDSRKIQFLKDDRRLLTFPKTLYTLVSRFKEDLNEKQIEYNKTCEYVIDIDGWEGIIGDD